MNHACVAVVCGDPGGAAAVGPVVGALRADGRVAVRALAYRQAGVVWTMGGLSFDTLDESIDSPAVLEILRTPPVSLLVTGTSLNSVMLESRFVLEARDTHIPSLAVLDSWLNYSERFTGARGERECLPDRIAVMDTRARDEMVADGFDPARLVITGQPAFDALAGLRERFTSARRLAVRARWGIGGQERAVLFASQPLSALYGKDPRGAGYPGFHEHVVLGHLLAALEDIATESRQPLALVVRPHPREDRGWLERLASAVVRIVVSSEGDPREAVMSADLVTGMNSLLLMEACYLQCVTVSLQPGLRHTDVLPTNRTGQSRPVYEPGAIRPVIEEFLLDDGARAAARKQLEAFAPIPGAARRVADVVYQMAGVPPA